jgi:hypothetical protein
MILKGVSIRDYFKNVFANPDAAFNADAET